MKYNWAVELKDVIDKDEELFLRQIIELCYKIIADSCSMDNKNLLDNSITNQYVTELFYQGRVSKLMTKS